MKLLACFLLLVLLTTSQASSGTPKIVNGRDAVAGQFPFYVGIIYSGNLICGGSIIAPRAVLTAAHCIIGASSNFRIGYGGLTESSMTKVRVASIAVHESYDSTTEANDIALIITSADIPVGSSTVQTIAYDQTTDSSFTESTILYAIGLGALNGGSSQNFPTTLQWTWLLHVPLSVCEVSNDGLTSNQICTSANVTDTCQGDSGGPVVYSPNQSGTPGVPLESPVLVGLVSYGKGCAANFPGVNTRVSAYYNWIMSKLPAASSTTAATSSAATSNAATSSAATSNAATSSAATSNAATSSAAASNAATSSAVGSNAVTSSAASTPSPSTAASSADSTCASYAGDAIACLSNPDCRFNSNRGGCRYDCRNKSSTECQADSRCKYITALSKCRTRRGF